MASLIFTSMSRTPVAPLMEPTNATESQAFLAGAGLELRPAALALRRVAVGPAGGPESRGMVSLAVPAGSAHALVGAAGSGKSALIERIVLARPPASGEIALFGEDVARTPAAMRYQLRRRLGVVFQEPRLIDTLSAHDNLALAVLAAGREAASAEARAEILECLAWVGLGRRAQTLAGSLDLDGRRRLALARAVINGPALVIADEPAKYWEGGDWGPIAKLLLGLRAAGIAMLVALRDTRAAEELGLDATLMPPLQPDASALAGGEANPATAR